MTYWRICNDEQRFGKLIICCSIISPMIDLVTNGEEGVPETYEKTGQDGALPIVI